MRLHLRLIAVILFLVVFWAAFELSGLRDHFSLAFLQQRLQDYQVTGLLTFMLLFALANLIQVPGWLFLVAAVLTLGHVRGGVATYLAACLSCAITFVTIRLVGGDALRELKYKTAQRLLNQLDSHPIQSVVLLRLLFQTLPALNYALAMSGIRFRPYMIGTLLGMPLPIILFCVFFDYLARLLGFI